MRTDSSQMAARLEEAFADGGFAEIGVDDLRAHTQVSLRTLYKHFPSRAEMVLAALEHRHERYLAWLYEDLPESPDTALEAIFRRVDEWMETNAPQGCLFQSAAAAYPGDVALRRMLERHKTEVARRMARASNLEGFEDDLLLIHEGVTQTWRLLGSRAVERAIVQVGALGDDKRV